MRMGIFQACSSRTEHHRAPIIHPESSATIGLEGEAENNSHAEDDAPPDGGYGWVCVAACFTINCFTWGVVAVSDSGSAGILELES